jgi:hypothetical protein
MRRDSFTLDFSGTDSRRESRPMTHTQIDAPGVNALTVRQVSSATCYRGALHLASAIHRCLKELQDSDAPDVPDYRARFHTHLAERPTKRRRTRRRSQTHVRRIRHSGDSASRSLRSRVVDLRSPWPSAGAIDYDRSGPQMKVERRGLRAEIEQTDCDLRRTRSRLGGEKNARQAKS